jgi:hypothetical protein
VAIEHPLGFLLGEPGDREGQTEVLRATLRALEEMETPGAATHLPNEWTAPARKLGARPRESPPFTKYLVRHPWHIPNLFRRDIPLAHRQ